MGEVCARVSAISVQRLIKWTIAVAGVMRDHPALKPCTAAALQSGAFRPLDAGGAPVDLRAAPSMDAATQGAATPPPAARQQPGGSLQRRARGVSAGTDASASPAT